MTRIGQSVARGLRRLAHPGIQKKVIGLQILVYIIIHLRSDVKISYWLAFSQENIFQGEVWRLFSWYFVPVTPEHHAWVILNFMFMYLFSEEVERSAGVRTNTSFYLLTWLLPTVFCLFTNQVIWGNPMLGIFIFIIYTGFNPKSTISLMFVLPVPAWLMNRISWISFFAMFLGAFNPSHYGDFLMCVGFLLSYMIFFGLPFKDIDLHSPKARMKLKAIHCCIVCSATELSDESKFFRVCSECEEEFCETHLKDHGH